MILTQDKISALATTVRNIVLKIIGSKTDNTIHINYIKIKVVRQICVTNKLKYIIYTSLVHIQKSTSSHEALFVCPKPDVRNEELQGGHVGQQMSHTHICDTGLFIHAFS